MKSDPFFDPAKALALRASREILALLHQPVSSQRKEDRSLVTEADLRADEILRDGLAEAFPEHAILTEENGLAGPRDAEYVWLVDPLDGTKAFVKGIPGFSVLVGLLKNGAPHLGIVVDPLESRFYGAVRGKGAFQEWGGGKAPLKVSSRKEIGEMPVVVSTGFPEKALVRLGRICPGPQLRPINSVGIKVGLLVRGQADVYVSHHPVHFWDTCAPQLILEEAGGVFTKLDGGPLVYDLSSDFQHEGPMLATNGTRHSELASKLADLFQR